GVHDGYLIGALQFRDRFLRDEQCAIGEIEFDPNAPELSRTKSIVGIWEQRRDPQRSGSGTDLPISRINLPLERIDCAIRQDQINFQLAKAFVTIALRLEELREVDIGLFGDI